MATDAPHVGIIGGGPAGLLLARCCTTPASTVSCWRAATAAYVEQRQRAGILERSTVDVLRASGAGERLDREDLVHDGIELRWDHRYHRIDFPSLTGGRRVWVYAQTEVCKDLIADRSAQGPDRAAAQGRCAAALRGPGAGRRGRRHLTS